MFARFGGFKGLLEKFEKPFMIGTGAILLTAFLMNLEFNMLESSLYDFRMRMGAQPYPSQNIALITVDDNTTSRLEEFSPLPLDQHVRFLETLEKYNPKAVGYLVDMSRVVQSYPELLKTEWSARFVGVASRMETKGVPFILGTPFDVNGEVVPPYPLSAVPHSVAVIHKDGNVFGEDKITRRALLSLYGKSVFHREMAERLGAIDPNSTIRGQFTESVVDADYFFFRYHGPTAYGQNIEKTTQYPVYSFIDIMEGRIGARELQDKIILVGTMSRDDSSDYTFTPYSKRGFVNPKIVVHANILDSVMNNRGIIRAPGLLNAICTFLVTGFVIWSVFTYTPLYGVFNTITLALGFLLVGQVLFSIRGLWIREAQPLVGIFLAYYLAVPYRLIQEYKSRWDYQRKNEILMQVEELKTNFLRLVTHDLKTPVARIQGLAEMVLRKTASKIEAPEQEHLKHIMNSTEELNHFITSVLELTKVESNRVRLQLESKDVNLLVEQALERFAPQSQSMSITLEMNLEPLFPIKVDTSLITKVLHNLIDNAMKYSLAGSTVWVTTREIDSFVEISVVDQGIGLSSDELSNLFTRFYRAKNDQTTVVSGTGLGLYLTKFFIEAHQGRVEVQSEKGKGSTFKIFLPTELVIADGETVRPGLKTVGKPARKENRYV